MKNDRNPYKWDGHRPSHPVRRQDLLDKVRERTLRGESGYLVGCRGMGKSVFLHQLEGDLRSQADIELFRFDTVGLEATIAAAVRAIADKMVEASRKRGAAAPSVDLLQRYSAQEKLRELFNAYLDAAPNELEHLVLLYDELDAYAPFGSAFFSELEDIRKNSNGRIVVFAAGGLGLVALDTLLGSSFFSRLTPEILEPFDGEGLARLAEPFGQRGAPLSEDVLHALRLASGGNLALATFGLQHLWTIDEPSPADVTEIFAAFRDKHAAGVFNMLRSTGLIRCSDDAYRRASIDVAIISSILTLDVPEPSTKGSLREQLVADLSDVLTSIQRMSPDFFRSAQRGVKQIVPEAVFSAGLVLGLEPRGWKVEREAQSAAGRTDIKARHIDFGDRWVVVEVKIWDRNDYEASTPR